LLTSLLNFRSTRTLSVDGAAMPKSPMGDSLLQLRSIKGEEALSKGFEYTLELTTPAEAFIPEQLAANIDLKAMIAKPLTVIVQCEGFGTYIPGLPGGLGMGNIGACEREITGLVFEARYLGQGNRQARYEVKLKPWIDLARERTDFRIFQNKSVVDIVRDVLRPYAHSCDWRIGESYPALEYQVQYGESDYAFVQRLMAEHGLYWFVEHSNGYHRVVTGTLNSGTIVDAALIVAPSSTKNKDKTRDPEMHQTRKGRQWYFGMKLHIGVDSQSG
jgi:type VI secretion system secreted protein VgrG